MRILWASVVSLLVACGAPSHTASNAAPLDQVLVKGNLVEQMKIFGQWNDWQHRTLGFPAGE